MYNVGDNSVRHLKGNDAREHITGTEFFLELSANVVDGEVELCATADPPFRSCRRYVLTIVTQGRLRHINDGSNAP